MKFGVEKPCSALPLEAHLDWLGVFEGAPGTPVLGLMLAIVKKHITYCDPFENMVCPLFRQA